MAQSIGDEIGPYRILAAIGAGGMGDVYRATDRRLNRDVAIKIARDRFSSRFETEARAVAALNHPNICTLYDVGPNYIVMELIEGTSPKGPLPLEEALRIARQIADALGAAHDKGIVHRDLKPGNLKITHDGAVKVLDFGLAKTVRGEREGRNSEDSPTITVSATEAGMIVGTAAYMSPEQAQGKPVDKRADIWAFGVVLYELLVGDRPFQGGGLTEVLASVMKDSPDLTKAPVRVRRLLASCLEKDPRARLRDIGDAWRLLEEPVPARTRSMVWPWTAAACAALLAVVGWLRSDVSEQSGGNRGHDPRPRERLVGKPERRPDAHRLRLQIAHCLRGLWGDGAKIPLIAKIRLANSSDNEVKLESGLCRSVAIPRWIRPRRLHDACRTNRRGNCSAANLVFECIEIMVFFGPGGSANGC